jgi:hypothetical protein
MAAAINAALDEIATVRVNLIVIPFDSQTSGPGT